MIIDCDGCTAGPAACDDCVVTVLLGMPQVGQPVELDDAEQAAVGVLAAAGLVPPLRLLGDTHEQTGPAPGEPTYDGTHDGGAARAG